MRRLTSSYFSFVKPVGWWRTTTLISKYLLRWVGTTVSLPSALRQARSPAASRAFVQPLGSTKNLCQATRPRRDNLKAIPPSGTLVCTPLPRPRPTKSERIARRSPPSNKPALDGEAEHPLPELRAGAQTCGSRHHQVCK